MSPDDPRLRLVEPQFREQVAQRLAAVEDFLANPGRNKAKQVGERVGLKKGAIQKLARIWKRTGDPRALIGKQGRRTVKPKRRPDQDAIIEKVIKERMAQRGNLAKTVAIQAEIAGVPVLSGPMIYDAAKSVRKSLKISVEPCDISLGLLVIDLPVLGPQGPVRPHLLTVLDNASLSLLGVALAADRPQLEDWQRALLWTLSATAFTDSLPAARAITISVPGIPKDFAPQLKRLLDGDGIDVAIREANERAREIGNRSVAGPATDAIGPMLFKHRVRSNLALTSMERRRPGKHLKSAVPADDAETWLNDQLARQQNCSAFDRLNNDQQIALRNRLSRS